MSVKSQIDRIKDVVSEQENLLQQMKTNLVGKAAGNGGGVELPTLQNQGNSEHLLEGKQLINQSGIRVIGRMPNKGAIDAMIDGLTAKSYTVPEGYHNGSGTVSLTDDIDNIALEQGDLIQQIKTALAEKAAGGGVELPDIAEEELGTASDLANGKKLIGPDGEIVEGNLSVLPGYYFDEDPSTCELSPNGRYLSITTPVFTDRVIMDTGAIVYAFLPLTDFGDAGPEDVRAGKTFTSESGLKTEGALEVGITPSGTLNITENGTHEVTNYASVNVNVASSSGYKSGDIVKAFPASATLASGYNVSSVSASDSVKKNENGEVSLSGVTSTVAIGYIDNVKGRYVKASSGSIYYVPADATITQGGTSYNKTYTVDKANLMVVLA